MTILVAITGGIGAGKSTLSDEIKKKGFSLLDSDEEVKKIYKKPNKEFLSYLKKINLGKSINKGKINKSYITNAIFNNENIKNKLEKYIFATIRRRRKLFINREKKRKKKIIFFDIPLLFETNQDKNFDIVISVISLKKERYKRLKKSKKMSKTLFSKIIKKQTTDVQRKKNSDIIINNNSNMQQYIKKINKTLNKITK